MPVPRLVAIILGVLWVVGGTAGQLLRQAGAPATDTIWAEDGSPFLRDALREGPFAPVFDPYAGYLHLVPRLIAGLVSLAPAPRFAILVAVGSALTVSMLSVFVFQASRSFIRSHWRRGLCAALVVFLPALVWESSNNATNLQWSLIFPCFLALAGRFETARVAGSAVAFLAAASAPTTVILLPLATVRLLQSTRGTRMVPISFLAGLGLQAMVALTAGGDPFGPSTNPLDLPGLYGLRVAGSLFVGEWVLPTAWQALGWVFGWVAFFLATGVVTYGLLRFRTLRGSIAWASAASIALFCFPVFVRGTSLLVPQGPMFVFHGSKWVIAPILLLTLTTLMILENLDRGPAKPALDGLFVLVVAVAVVMGFRAWNGRSSGPRWSAGIAEARETCRIEMSKRGSIPISPPGWEVPVPCARLDAAALPAGR